MGRGVRVPGNLRRASTPIAATLAACACLLAWMCVSGAGVAAAQMPGGPPSGPAPGSGPGFSGPCATQSGSVRIAAIWARKPGGGWENALASLCPLLTYSEQPDPTGGITRMASFSLATAAGQQDLSAVYPVGTEFSVELQSSAAAPLAVAGAMADPIARIDGGKITVQGKATQVKFAFQSGPGGPNCSAGTMTMRSFFGGGVMLEPSGSGQAADSMRSYKGAFFGTNAQNAGLPIVSGDGRSVTLSVAGCGDGDPNTEDGFFTGFLPSTGTAEMGLGSPLLRSISDPVADQLMELKDNGASEPEAGFEVASRRDVQLESTPGTSVTRASSTAPAGLVIDYRLSFSQHSLSTTSNRKNVKKAKACQARGGKLKLKRGRGKAKKTLACLVRKKKKHR